MSEATAISAVAAALPCGNADFRFLEAYDLFGGLFEPPRDVYLESRPFGDASQAERAVRDPLALVNDAPEMAEKALQEAILQESNEATI